MSQEHVISDELFREAQTAFSNSENWVAFNTISYFLDKGEVYFFKDQDSANEFSDNNISEYDNYKVIYARSLDELLKQIPYGEKLIEQLSNSTNLSTMNEKNLDYLSNQLKFTGFGEELQPQLKVKMERQEAEFTLFHQKDYGKDQTVATLHFRKSDESEMYFFNRYSLMLKNETHPDALKQTFYINNKEAGITLKEAYNMLCGRAVHKDLSTKEGEKYTAWLQLNFKESDTNGNYKLKQFHQNYGYDIKAVLATYPIKEMATEENKQRLMDSLERGNRQSVTLDLGGKEVKMFIEASPQFKSLNLYDTNMKRVTMQSLKENNSQEQSQQQSSKQNQRQDMNDDGPGEKQPKKSRRRKQSIT